MSDNHPIHSYLGIFHMELATLTQRHAATLSPDNPLRVTMVHRKGAPHLRFCIGNEAATIELPEGLEARAQTVRAVIEQLRQAFAHVVVDEHLEGVMSE